MPAINREKPRFSGENAAGWLNLCHPFRWSRDTACLVLAFGVEVRVPDARRAHLLRMRRFERGRSSFYQQAG
jgi:hypothetical protein